MSVETVESDVKGRLDTAIERALGEVWRQAHWVLAERIVERFLSDHCGVVWEEAGEDTDFAELAAEATVLLASWLDDLEITEEGSFEMPSEAPSIPVTRIDSLVNTSRDEEEQTHG